MKLRIEENSTNYPCTVVEIGKIFDIEGADKIKRTVIFGNEIIVSSDVKEGDVMLYFVAGTQLDTELCFNNNLYVDSEFNKNKEKKGYVSHKKRLIKAIKLRGIISDGLLLPIESLSYLDGGKLDPKGFLKKGDSFTHIGDIEVCKKYIVERKQSDRQPGEKKPKKNKLKDLLIDTQFRFHNETSHFLREFEKLNLKPKSRIVITRKYHGSSLILSHVLINKKLNWIERLIDRFVKLPKSEYGFVYSSGKPKSRLPKGIEAENVDWKNNNGNYYSEDIWKKAYSLHKDKLEKGITIYGEIVGKGVQGSEYTYGFDYEIFVYRITQTNVDGNVYEFSWSDLKKYCDKYGLKYVDEYFVGTVSDITTDGNKEELLRHLHATYMNKSYKDCKVDEGICIRIEDTNEIYKMKSPLFIMKESNDLENGLDVTSE